MASTNGARIRAEQRLRAEGNWPQEGRSMPGWLFDRMAEQKLSGGYRIRPDRKGRVRNPVCPGCFVAKSLSGECNCG